MRSLSLLAAFLPLAASFVGGCSFDSDDESKSETFKYQFNDNGCDTGAQSFNDKDAYCAALKNEALNKGCAKESRDTLHAKSCS